MLTKILELKNRFPETKDFIEERIEEECSKENMSKEQVIFLFTYQKVKS